MSKTIAILAPEMTIEKYAEAVGVTPRVVRSWIERGYIPSVKVGKWRLVNVAQRTLECLDEKK